MDGLKIKSFVLGSFNESLLALSFQLVILVHCSWNGIVNYEHF